MKKFLIAFILFSFISLGTLCQITADFTADITTGGAPLTVNFTNLSTGSPDNFEWDFNNDGWIDSTEENPSYTYNVNGIYTVTLRSYGSAGDDTQIKNDLIVVGDCSYCASSGSSSTEEGITNVAFGTINNPSSFTNYIIGIPSYRDYTSISTNITTGSTYNLAVTIGQWEAWEEHVWAFFDWNQDCDFEDPGESFDLGDITSGTLDINVLVPNDAVLGNTKMRISVMYNSDPGPCSQFTHGEVEDYTVIIISPPLIMLSHNSYDFGTVIMGECSEILPLVIKNIGGNTASGYCSLNSWLQFSINPPGGFSLNPGDSLIVDVKYCPVSTDGTSDILTVDGNFPTVTSNFYGNTYCFQINTFANPPEGGNTSPINATITDMITSYCFTAEANPEYEFVNWEHDGNIVSTDPYYCNDYWNVDCSSEPYILTANFQSAIPPLFTIAPEFYDFGTVMFYDCSDDIPFIIKNIGGNAGFAYFELQSSLHYNLSQPGPFYLNPGDSAILYISYCPVSLDGTTDKLLLEGFTIDEVHLVGWAYDEVDVFVDAIYEDGGSVTGGGTYTTGEQCCINAIPNPGYTFMYWSEDPWEPGSIYTPEYCFTIPGYTGVMDYYYYARFFPFEFQLKVNLSSCYNGSDMNPYPEPDNFPLDQPYNISPWYYDGTETVYSLPNGDIADWVLVELRDPPGDASTADASTSIASQAAFLLTDGSVVSLDGSSGLTFEIASSTNFHVIIWHRNHLGIISADPLIGTSINNKHIYSYDFTDDPGKAFGGELAQKEVAPNTWSMIGGDGNKNSIVEDGDKSIWKLDAGKTDYVLSDYNLDGEINNIDKNDIWLKNLWYASHVPPVPNMMKLDPEMIHFEWMSSWPLSVNIASNVSWSVINPCSDWVSVSPVNGENIGDLSVDCEENYSSNSRSCDITVEGGGISRIFTVEQHGSPWLTLNVYNTTVPCNADTLEVIVSSNASWYVSPQYDCEWLNVEPVNGVDNGSFNIIYDENSISTERCCMIYVFYSAVGFYEYAVLNICQDPQCPYLNIDPEYVLIPYEEDPIVLGTINVTSNVSWTVSNPCTEWLVATPSGVNDGTIYLEATSTNWGSTSKICTLSITGGEITKEFIVQQEGYPFCYIDPSVKDVDSEAGSYIVDVTSNGQWYIGKQCIPGDWIDFSPSSGTENGSFTVTYDANYTGEERCCQLYVFYTSLSGYGFVEYAVHTLCQDATSGIFVCGDPLYDDRNGKSYNTVEIDTRCWMAENLNYGNIVNLGVDQIDNSTVEKYCLDDLESNCDIYGANYQWGEAMNYISIEGSQGICPDGWYVPTDSDWCLMENFVDSDIVECDVDDVYRGTDGGGHLKSQSTLWSDPNVGATDMFGFSAEPGGYYNYFNGQMGGVGLFSQFFTSTITAPDNPWTRGLQSDLSTIRRKQQSGEFGQNLRCIKSQ